MSEAVIQVKAVERTFGGGETAARVLRGVELTVGRGKLLALYGPSGSGKTTLLNLIGALDRPNAGSIEVCGQTITNLNDGKRTAFRREQFGFIFQSYTLLPTYSAAENIDLALRLRGIGLFERRRRTKAALEVVGLTAWTDHMPDELSGGQRQRITIARALALRPPVILADEPTSGLDTQTAKRIMHLFRKVAETQQTTFVIVSHDQMIATLVDLACDLVDGKVVPRAAVQFLPHPPTPSPNGEGELIPTRL